MFQKIVRFLGGDPNKREIDKLSVQVDAINRLEPEYEKFTDAQLRAKTDEFRQRLAQGETLDDILVEAFATVRETSKRTLGMRHYDVQLMGGMVLHSGTIAEMRTGEGKTLVATLPMYLNALTGRGVHLVTVNDYLARRDARWKAPIFQFHGMSVGVLQMASRTENGKKAFVVDPDKASPFEDQHHLRMVDRAEAYRADIIYGTNSEFGFDYLRDNLTNRLEDRSQRGHYFAIVDEVDNILIDEARTPLIISGPAADETEWYVRMAQVVRALKPEDFEINERDRQVTLTEVGAAHVEELLDMTLGDPDRPEDISPEQARVLGYLEQALRAHHLYKRNKDYIIQGGKVVIVDEFTGRLMPGRRWSEGLHQSVEAKEGVRVEPENVTYATITIQNYFRMYEKLAGMTGTALTEAEEFAKIYKLEVLPIPTNLEYNVLKPSPTLVEVNDKDPQGYKFNYYARREDPLKAPVYWRRKDYPDVIYRTEEAKIRAITMEIIRYHVLGRPQLVGTTSVEHSERLSQRLQPELLRRLMQAVLIRDAWLKKNNRQESEVAIPELNFLYRPLPELNAGELRQFARGVNMNSINPEDPGNLERLLPIMDLTEADIPRLTKILQGGVTHLVLNARKHDEESQIIARAGAFGAVTIATNMAGRGVDIKLGGELDEDLIRDVIRVLRRAGTNPYEMNNEERRKALLKVPEEQYGIYNESVQQFLLYMDNMEKVRQLGGLHVIGSERHEARRIDNQLRGRSSRQGDPGSSRFYLSLEDDLMRLFGGQQVEGLLSRLNIDESLPIENNLVARLVEQSQTRVEGANFDVRKHLLEYDDVLNLQRKRIYELRDRVFVKDDLTDDVDEMLQQEMGHRIPAAFEDEEGPWKLLAFLDEIQPVIETEAVVYPSYTYRLLLREIEKTLGGKNIPADKLRSALLDVARKALEAERDHLQRAAETLLDRTEEALEQQRLERFDALDAFFQGLPDRLEEAGGQLRPQELAEELSSLARVPVKLSNDELRRLANGDYSIADSVRNQVDAALVGLQVARVSGSLERRIEDLEFKPGQFQNMAWQDIANQILDAVAAALQARIDRLAGESGQIDRDMETAFGKVEGASVNLDQNQRALVGLLRQMTLGTRMTFDRKTHRRGQQNVVRLAYIHYASRLLQNREPEEATKDILDHLNGARTALQFLWGRFELGRLLQAESTLNRLDESLQSQLMEELGRERYEQAAGESIRSLSPEEIARVIRVLGRRLQNEIFRQVLLSVISNLWVDYLTRVDALRVSIGLEAFAQRDPLVQYKSRATEMFQTLLDEIRGNVVMRMFVSQPSRASTLTMDRERAEAAEDTPSAAPQAAEPAKKQEPAQGQAKKKKRRH